MDQLEYTAIKIKGQDFWTWFQTKNVQEKDFKFIGKSGWGKNGNLTNVNIPINLIEGRITSSVPQY